MRVLVIAVVLTAAIVGAAMTILTITRVGRPIAFHTNLLALNAGVEAARASSPHNHSTIAACRLHRT